MTNSEVRIILLDMDGYFNKFHGILLQDDFKLLKIFFLLTVGTLVTLYGDRVILGGDHYFRFNHPIEASKPGRKSIGKGLKDFEFARKELLDVQNAK